MWRPIPIQPPTIKTVLSGFKARDFCLVILEKKCRRITKQIAPPSEYSSHSKSVPKLIPIVLAIIWEYSLYLFRFIFSYYIWNTNQCLKFFIKNCRWFHHNCDGCYKAHRINNNCKMKEVINCKHISFCNPSHIISEILYGDFMTLSSLSSESSSLLSFSTFKSDDFSQPI